MAIFDILKKKKAAEPIDAKKTPSKAVEAKEMPRVEKMEKVEKAVKSARRVEKKQFSEAYRILKSPHVTEKAGMLAEKNSYVFKVSSAANKNEVKQAVQDLYGVAVKQVNIVNIPRKARRVGRNEGFKPGFKKAIVKLAEGEKIEIMPR